MINVCLADNYPVVHYGVKSYFKDHPETAHGDSHSKKVARHEGVGGEHDRAIDTGHGNKPEGTHDRAPASVEDADDLQNEGEEIEVEEEV